MGWRRGLGLQGAHFLEAGAPEFKVKTKSIRITHVAVKGEAKIAVHDETAGEQDTPPYTY